MSILKSLFGPKPNTIYKSITNGDYEEIESYLNNTPDLNSDFQFESILHYTIDNCEKNYFDIIKLLINKGVDVNSSLSKLHETPLHRLCARMTPRMDVIKYIIEKGADTNAVNKAGKSPVFYCTFSFSSELLKLLAEHGADINLRDKYGNTLLHDDFIDFNPENFEEFLKTLLDLGFDINGETPAGLTPLNFCENIKFENILKKYGARKNPV
ncbi:MAG: ankyrin repeat domain-containing protein [Solirubrobacterales bacterium]